MVCGYNLTQRRNGTMRHFHFLLLLTLVISASGQATRSIIGDYTHYQLAHAKDTIDFVVADTTLSQRKPVLLFCQGSQPVPLFIDFGKGAIVPVPLDNFDLPKLKLHYHVVVISMPKTPVVAGIDQLNDSYCFVPDTSRPNRYSEAFLRNDRLDNYVDRANAVIAFLLHQGWVDPDGLVVAGHSQGARVAAGIATANTQVDLLGLFGFNPLGRITQEVWKYRLQAQQGKISWETADSLQQRQYAFYKEVLNSDSLDKHPEYQAWRTFSASTMEDLAYLDIPVYVANGSEDYVAVNCDLLPLYFIQQGKSNLTLIRYPYLEHNFFEVGPDGKADHSKKHWERVMNAFIQWAVDHGSGSESR